VFDFPLKISKKINYKNLIIRVSSKEVLVKAPLFLPLKSINSFIKKNEEKIKKVIAKNKNKKIMKERLFDAKKKNDAIKFITDRIKILDKESSFTFKNIRVKNQKSLWGSCSVRKNLNFNHRILDIPVDLADYLIVHELCHLKEMNHSKNFWKLVSMFIPDYKERRARLKKYYF